MDDAGMGRSTASPSSDAATEFGHELEVRLARARLSRNDERVLQFLGDHFDEVAFHTSESIAQGAGVSRAAVVRFARRLGYAGFAELRDRHRRELQRPDALSAPRTQEATTLLERKVKRDIENLSVLPAVLDGALEEAAERAHRARQIWLMANRETYGLIVYFHRLLHHVRSNLVLIDPAFADPLRDITSDDVLLACTFRPYARQTLALVDHARTAGAHVIAITDGSGNRLLDEADTVLAVPVESPTMFLSFTAATAVLEALAAHIARLDVDGTYERLEATGRFVHGQRLMVEPGPLTGTRRRRNASK